MSDIKAMIEHDEGNRLKPYLDCCGKAWRECACANKGSLTIGRGRNLDEMGISEDESEILCENDIKRAIAEADGELTWFARLDETRQDVILDMLFNLGVTRFRKFTKMIEAIERRDFEKAADEMLDSQWAKQLPERAQELALMMREGKHLE